MARTQNNSGGNRTNRSNNNNPEGHNQYNSGWMGMARDRPATAAAVAAGTVAAGVFLWSKRAQITEQLSLLSEQIGEWTENMNSTSQRELETVGNERGFSGSTSTGSSSELGEMKSVRRNNKFAAGTTGQNTGQGSGTMSGGSLDTGPSGRNPA